MLSFSNFLLTEDVKKDQIKTLFSNFDFKVGLEFEFFNEDFIEKNEMPKLSPIIILDELSDELQRFINWNRIIISDNLKGETKKDLFGYKHFENKFGSEKIKKSFEVLSEEGFSELEITEMIHYGIFKGIINSFRNKLSPEELEEEGAKKGQLRLEIINKYKSGQGSQKLRNFEKLLNKARAKTLYKDDAPFNIFKKYYKSVENLPACVKNPTISDNQRSQNSKSWMIKQDPSIAGRLGGVEFISPVMSPYEALTTAKEMFTFISKVGHTNSQHLLNKKENPRTTQCGLHINISMKGEQMKNFDALKFIIFSNEGQLKNEKLFGDRQDSVMIQPVLEKLRKAINKNSSLQNENIPNNMKILNTKLEMLSNKKNELNSELEMLSNKKIDWHRYRNINFTGYDFKNRKVQRKGSERIEVRFFGGEDYHKKFDTFKRVLGELLHAMDVASDPDKEIKKYYKSLYKIINDGEKKNEK